MSVVSDTGAYEHARCEPKWQKVWRERGSFATPDPESGREDAYVFVAPPFTSGEAHMGHVRSYTIGDAHARFRRARGDAVLYSLGFDSFGLPAELGAVKHGLPPAEWVSRCSRRMRDQFDQLGFSFDWSRTFLTCEPNMYRWTQWLFLTLLEANLIYRYEGHVDWCDGCQTVLARAQVEDGCCWRCHGELRLVRRTQWFLHLSAYNEENERRIDKLTERWSDAAISAQRTLLGRVEGVEFDSLALNGSTLTLFTPFPDDVPFGAFAALSPRHPDLDRWVESEEAKQRIETLREGGLEREKRRAAEVPVVETGASVHVSGIAHPLPVVVSPAVDSRYGPTAVLGIPEIDRTDRTIAEQLREQREPTLQVKMRPLLKRPAIRYRASDFPISRQRAWGAPIPIIHCGDCGAVPVPVDQLPVRLPDDLAVSGEGNVLAEDEVFTACECPSCGKPARRETDTLDCHVDVFWIYMAAAVRAEERGTALFESPELRRWLPVTQFIQGADTGGFVLDERMVAKALRDLGVFDFLPDGEPYGPTLMHEMVQLDGRKMSKHLGNVVTPEELVEQAGADALRFAVLYAAAPRKRFSWDANVLDHCRGFLDRLWAFAEPRLAEVGVEAEPEIETSTGFRRRLASWCATAAERITENYETLEMHRATRNAMTLLDRIEDFERRVLERTEGLTERDRESVQAALLSLTVLIAPVAPHIAEELWHSAKRESIVAEVSWPIERRSVPA